MKRAQFISIAILALFLAHSAKAQRVSISTNTLEWLNLGTANIEASIAISQYFTLNAGVRYNPWEFHQENPYMVIQEKQKTAYFGARWWTWYVFSGWWAGIKIQYQDFAESGLWRPALDTWNAVGAGLSAGYTLMLTKHLNLDFGLGLWGGYKYRHVLYNSPATKDIRESGPKPFVAPDILSVSIMYVF